MTWTHTDGRSPQCTKNTHTDRRSPQYTKETHTHTHTQKDVHDNSPKTHSSRQKVGGAPAGRKWVWPYGMLDRCSVADGGKMLLKFLEPGFLKRWRAEPEKSCVSVCSSGPAAPRGSCTTGCLDRVTRITFPWRRWPFRWLIAAERTM